MIPTPATFLAIAGTAFVLGSYAPAALEARAFLSRDSASLLASMDSRAPLPHEHTPVAASASGKGDRLPVRRAEARARSSVSTVEIIGLSEAIVVLRDRDGTVLYRSDPLSNTTLVTKDADLPVVTLKEAPSAPAVQQSPDPSAQRELSPKREGQEGPTQGPRRPRMIGCEAAVSPLARGGVQDLPGRCLAQAQPLTAS
jgi:hypothetical protein